MSAKWLFTFKHFKFPLLPLLTHSAMLRSLFLLFNEFNFVTIMHVYAFIFTNFFTKWQVGGVPS